MKVRYIFGGNFFWLCWGLEKKKFAVPVGQFFFLFWNFVSFLFWEFVLNLGRGRGRWQGKTSSFLSKLQWFFKPEELYEKMNDKLPTKVRPSVRGRWAMWENGWRCFTVDSHPSTSTWDFSFPNGSLFLVVRYQILQNRPSSQNPPRISLSHVVRHNCKSSPTNVWELKFRGSRQVHCVHKRENKPYIVFILIEGGVGYAFLYRDSRETHDDNDAAEIIFLLLLVAVAVDCWFLMPQKHFGWGMAKIRETKRETDIARKVQRGADGSYMHQTQVVLFDRFATVWNWAKSYTCSCIRTYVFDWKNFLIDFTDLTASYNYDYLQIV